MYIKILQNFYERIMCRIDLVSTFYFFVQYYSLNIPEDGECKTTSPGKIRIQLQTPKSRQS